MDLPLGCPFQLVFPSRGLTGLADPLLYIIEAPDVSPRSNHQIFREHIIWNETVTWTESEECRMIDTGSLIV
jgi:hypothetical protein